MIPSLEMFRGIGFRDSLGGGVFLAEEPTPSPTDTCDKLINIESYCLCNIVVLASVVALSG